MSVAILRSRALTGVHAPEVVVEAHLGSGLPSFTVVGLPEAEVRESRDRVRAAIQNSRFEFPASRITVNLAPADLPKESGRYDLPIALGILAASGQIPLRLLADYEFAGELALTGELRPVRGALAMVIGANKTARFILPAGSATEASLVAADRVLAATSLLEVCAHLCGQKSLQPPPGPISANAAPNHPVRADLADVRGQAAARRALEIAAAGGHSLLMSGPPGSGKSMLAERLAGILPPMNREEALESASILSLAGHFQPEHWQVRPFRAPHHTASAAALVGGGSNPRPGEISLAHQGVLFLDELPEFSRSVLEVLREPLETGRICISRAARQAEFPARFQLVAAMNPCPCGYLGDHSGRCRCTPDKISRYRDRISGPLLDRIDVQIEVPAIDPGELQMATAGETSPQVRARVVAARQRQITRQGKANSSLSSAEIDRHAAAGTDSLDLLSAAIRQLGLSARAWHRTLKVARSVADLAGSDHIQREHMAEAIHLRRNTMATRPG